MTIPIPIRPLINSFVDGQYGFNAADSVINLYPNGTATSFTIPPGTAYIKVRADGAVALQFNGGTASFPVSPVLDGSGSVIISANSPPQIFACTGLSVVSVDAAASVHISVEFFTSKSQRPFTSN